VTEQWQASSSTGIANRGGWYDRMFCVLSRFQFGVENMTLNVECLVLYIFYEVSTSVMRLDFYKVLLAVVFSAVNNNLELNLLYFTYSRLMLYYRLSRSSFQSFLRSWDRKSPRYVKEVSLPFSTAHSLS